MSQENQSFVDTDGDDIKTSGDKHWTIRMFTWIKHETISVLPAIFYFFIAFNILIVNERLILLEYKVNFNDFARPAIGALVVAKLLILVNMLPFINAFPNKPLIWNTIWKTMIYWICGLCFQVIESIVELAFKYESLFSAYQRTVSNVQSPRFAVVQMWLFVLLLMFVALQELVRVLGPGKVRALFFGSRTTSEVRGNA